MAMFAQPFVRLLLNSFYLKIGSLFHPPLALLDGQFCIQPLKAADRSSFSVKAALMLPVQFQFFFFCIPFASPHFRIGIRLKGVRKDKTGWQMHLRLRSVQFFFGYSIDYKHFLVYVINTPTIQSKAFNTRILKRVWKENWFSSP